MTTTTDNEIVKEMKDYKTMSLEGLIEQLKQKLERDFTTTIKDEANAIRSSFYLKYNEDLAKAKAKAESETLEGEEDFEYKNQALQIKFKELWKGFLDKKNTYQAQLAKELSANLAKKEAIITSIKLLVEKGDVSSTYQEFKKLQEDWRAVGNIVSDKYQETWGNYNLYVEQFYDLLHLNNDLRSVEFKKNLEIKQKLVSKAQELLSHSDIQFAFNELQVLHKIWKEETGPVDREFRESIWEEFSEITNQLHDKKTAFYEELRKEEEVNYKAKLAKIEEIKFFDYSANKSFNDWKKSIESFEKLKEEFVVIGKVPKSKTNQVWNLFKDATKAFNVAKNVFFKQTKKEQFEAVSQKKSLIKEALEWSKSDDYVEVTNNLKRIQAEWKKTGFVPRKQADVLWNEFRSICDAHFDNLKQIKKEGTPQEKENYKQKVDFLDNLKSADVNVENYLSFVKKWLVIGKVPTQNSQIEKEIQSTLTVSVFDENSIEKEKEDLIKYQLKVAGWKATENKKFFDEVTYLRKNRDQAIKDVKQLENNLGFFANSKKTNPLLDNVMNSIEVEKQKVKQISKKIKFINSL